MEEIKMSFVSIWWWIQSADEQTIVSTLLVIATGTVVSYVVQFVKRKRNIDLRSKAKAIIISLLGFFTAAGSLADYYIQNMPPGFGGHFVQYFAYIWVAATIIHRIHVSKTYAKLERVLRSFAERLNTTRQVKYAPPVTLPPKPKPISFED